jgi:hypothetical protein
MRVLTIADGIFDRHEAITRLAVIIIVPLLFAIVAAAFYALSKTRKK